MMVLDGDSDLYQDRTLIFTLMSDGLTLTRQLFPSGRLHSPFFNHQQTPSFLSKTETTGISFTAILRLSEINMAVLGYGSDCAKV